MKTLRFACMLALLTAPLGAQPGDRPSSAQTLGQRTLFAPDESDPVLNCLPTMLCRLELEAGEIVSDIAASSSAWTTDRVSSGPPSARTIHVLVWPSSAGAEGFLLVTTDRRVYSLRLLSDPSRPTTPVVAFSFSPTDPQRVRFRDPLVASATPTNVSLLDPTRLNTNYRVSRSRSAPSFVVDDGTKTYLFWKRLPQDTFVVKSFDTQGNESIETPHVLGNWFVLAFVAPRIQLVRGKTVVDLVNEVAEK